jgi:hypothetical protein
MTILITGGDPIPWEEFDAQDCDCSAISASAWACGIFEDDDTGYCMHCGHHVDCHDLKLP